MVWYNTGAESDQTFETLAVGTYRFIVSNATVKATKAGGEMAEATLEVVEGPAKGEKVWARFNVVNASEKAQKIGRAEMKRFLTACGVTEPLNSPNDFGRVVAHKLVWGDVTHEKGQDGKTYARVGGFAADVPGAPAPVRHVPSASTDSIPF